MGAVGRRLGVVGAAAVLLVLAAPGVAWAHPSVLATSPPAGYSVPAAPERVEVVFDEPVAVAARDMRMLADDGSAVATSVVRREQQGRRLVLDVSDVLAPGRYVVRWTVTAADGDVVEGGFDFAVAGAGDVELAGGVGGGTVGLPAAVLLRWLLWAGLVLAVGGWAGARLAHRVAHPDATSDLPPVGAPLRTGAIIGAVGAAGLLLHQAGRGSLVAGVGALAAGLPDTSAARTVAVELGLFVLAALVASVRTTRRWVVLPLAGVILAEGARTHLAARAGPAGAVLMAVHLAVVACWVGALVQVLRTGYVWRAHMSAVRRLLRGYAWMAGWLVGAVAVTGTAAALVLVPSVHDLVITGYGRVLVLKLVLVGAAVGAAWWARRALRRDPETGRVLRRAATERGVLAVVLACSAVLVSIPAAGRVTSDIGYPPVAVGPVVRQGWLAGQISVQIAATAGQLEVRLRTPDANPLVRAVVADFRFAARVVAAGVPGSRTVPLTRCGPGCYVGPIGWGAGANSVDLQVAAPGWHGGSASFTVTWPPRTDSRVLADVVAAMRAAGRFDLTETVTSDTSQPAPPPQTATVTAAQLLDGEPYGDGAGIEVVDLGPPATGPGSRVIAFGIPAEGVAIRMILDEANRILSETISAPKHQVERGFHYPGGS